jgi:hypothetical protein
MRPELHQRRHHREAQQRQPEGVLVLAEIASRVDMGDRPDRPQVGPLAEAQVALEDGARPQVIAEAIRADGRIGRVRMVDGDMQQGAGEDQDGQDREQGLQRPTGRGPTVDLGRQNLSGAQPLYQPTTSMITFTEPAEL